MVILLCFNVPALGLAAFNVAYFAAPRPSQTEGPTSTAVPGPLPRSAMAPPPPLCGGPRATFILLIGSDGGADNYSAGLPIQIEWCESIS